MDGTQPDVLPSICKVIENKIQIFLDSGVRKGADIIKAFALGAYAVHIGRPYAYPLAVAGEMGEKKFLKILFKNPAFS